MDKSIINKYKTNVIWQMQYQVMSIIMGIMIPYFVLRVYGSEVNGLTSTARNLVTLVSLLRAGISTAVIYSLYKPINDENNQEVTILLNYIEQKFNKISLYIIFLGLISSFIISVSKTSSFSTEFIFFACFILCLSTALDLWFTSVSTSFLTALQKKYILSQGMLLGDFVMYVMQIYIILYQMPIVLFYSAFLVGCLCKVLFLKYYYKREAESFGIINNLKISKERKDISGMGYATLNEIAHSFVFASPPIIVSYIHGFGYSSVISVYAMIINGLSLFYQVFTTSFMPSFGAICASNDINSINKSFNIFQNISTLLVTYMYMCTSTLILPFIHLYTNGVSDINYIEPRLAFLFIIYGFFYAARIPYNIVVASTGLFKKSGIQTGLTSFLCITTSVIGCSYNYILVMLGPILFYFLNTIYQHIFLQRDILGFKPDYFKRNLITSLISIYCLVFMKDSGIIAIEAVNYSQFLIIVIKVMFVSFVVLSLIFYVINKKCFLDLYNLFYAKRLR